MNCCSSTNNSTSCPDNKDKKCEMTFNYDVSYMGILMILSNNLLRHVHAFSTNANFQYN